MMKVVVSPETVTRPASMNVVPVADADDPLIEKLRDDEVIGGGAMAMSAFVFAPTSRLTDDLELGARRR